MKDFVWKADGSVKACPLVIIYIKSLKNGMERCSELRVNETWRSLKSSEHLFAEGLCDDLGGSHLASYM